MSNVFPLGWSSMRRSLVVAFAAFAIALCLLISGCHGFVEPIEDAKNTESAIKTELGVDATVGVRVASGMSGKKTLVTVKLKTTPTGDAAAIKSKVEDIVNHTFRSHVRSGQRGAVGDAGPLSSCGHREFQRDCTIAKGVGSPTTHGSAWSVSFLSCDDIDAGGAESFVGTWPQRAARAGERAM